MNDARIPPQPRLKERIESICRDMIEKGILFSEATEHFERCFIMEVMRRNRGNLTKAAASLGIHRNTLSKKANHWNHPRQ